MDRPEPGLVKWSPSSSLDSFVHINLQHRVVQLYEPTGHARNGRFDYDKLTRHDDFPPLTTYDWSPTNPGLLAVGTGTGLVNLLRIDDGSNAYLELGLKTTRTCQAVAFNTTGLLAVGLDRVRVDSSLHIWDVNRLSSLAKKQTRGLPKDVPGLSEPRDRVEHSVSVSSIKFFEDSPQTLVAGIKAQGLRLHDLRVAQHSYVQATEEDGLPWGGALRLDKVIDADFDPFSSEGKYSMVRSLRYCRDHRGLLAVLSRTGQLRILDTKRERDSSSAGVSENPELLQVGRSHEMDPLYAESSRRNNSIVSFDWVTLGSPVLRPRMLVLRANGNFEIVEQPSQTADHVYKMVPWSAPHRGLEAGTPYMDMMHFEPSQAPSMMGPLLIEKTLANVPIFGPEEADIEATIEHTLRPGACATVGADLVNGIQDKLPDSFCAAETVSGKLRALRAFVREKFGDDENLANLQPQLGNLNIAKSNESGISMATGAVGSCREFHEALLRTLNHAPGLPREAQSVIDHSMVLRAKERYLFDAAANHHVVNDDPWVKFAWDWIADAEHAADDGGMLISTMDLSYLGIASVWTNDLGRNPTSRLTGGAPSVPEPSHWERALGVYCNKKRHLPKFDGVTTKRPHHRQLCLEICGWGDLQRHDPTADVDPEYPATIHTMAASRALFRGDTPQAVQILKRASKAHPALLFVSLALQLMGRGDKRLAKEQLDFDPTVASNTDPYLQAMSSLIATGDWTSIANQLSLPLSDRAFVAVRNFPDDQLTAWLHEQVARAVHEGDVEGIVLTGITDATVDIFARYIQKFGDVQTATLVLSIGYPKYIDDIRCRAWRRAYREHLQRHKLFHHRTKFEVESTKRSKREGVPTLKPPSRQIALRCVYCDAETSLANHHHHSHHHQRTSSGGEARNPMLTTSINAGVSCPNCGRHLPRCIVCLEVVGVPRSDRPEEHPDTKMAGRFPTFCLRCDHVLHLDHARQWFARHTECPVPECRCRCNFRANPELSYH
ncbi:SEH-associated protein-like protein [Emericellopsis cladophorae]|uniref:SEH-associated protein-like protein n=1 Tax=Emericellopsis cladophorae TaxID=2686198 RepID=A0A9Q0BIE0_9HYPO|nr:SEH-associated protein-like protein [Emericellopsis cladophorae]KAI6785795.1 SEH-associated protein-like protein [Emericellopsis cladophorae]